MKIKPTVIDYETKPIDDRPRYPPEPVGVSIKLPGVKARYYAWGHPTENNCTKEDAVRALVEVYKSKAPLLFHNSKFDIDVGETYMKGLSRIALDPLRCHDTQFLLFLLDPHALDLGLKPSAAKWLGMPNDEQVAVQNWVLEHAQQLKAQGLLPGNVKLTPSSAKAWVCLAPGKLAGKYADGDVIRTEKLFQLLYPHVVERGMLPAYERELKLVPILLKNEREGMLVDTPAMEADQIKYTKAAEQVEGWLRKTLKAPDVNFNSPAQMAEVLDREGIITEWTLTPTGQKSMKKGNVKPSHYSNPKVFQALGYRNKLTTCTETYIGPWLETAHATGGRVHAGWNQTRNDRDAGARTGRLSGSPNFMAVAKSFEDKGDGWSHPDFIKGLPHLPLVRNYLLPDKGQVWGRRDFNQQEVRILAHFEDDLLLAAYRDNPRLDVHAFVQSAIYDLLGIQLPRTPIKTLNFGLIYGQGVPSMAEKIDRPVQDVQKMRDAQFRALPGLKDLDKLIKQMGRNGQCITTWGGRQYYAEDPRMIQGRMRTFEYKLLNYLIQGSAADCTKEALIRYDSLPGKDARFLVMVHDELNISADKKAFKAEMLKLREVMMSIEFDVPLLSDAEFGPKWGSLEPLKEPAPDLTKWSM
jgi:DNA polymerase I-like protein with 3'-5' exonuclease and polymerase domains